MSENQKCDCPEEKIVHMGFGPVENEEMLARYVLLDDKKLVKNNRIVKGALNTDGFRKTDGWSFSREGHIVDITKELEKRSAKKDGRPYGYVLVKAAVVREFWDEVENRAAIRVIEAPQEHNPAHALAERTREYNKSDAKDIRDNLLNELSDVLTC